MCCLITICHRAFEVLGLTTDGITVQQLESILPNEFGGKFKDSKICERLKIEALYQASVQEQQEDIERVELDQSLLVPNDIDYAK